jgi:polyphosphate kinase 2
MYPTMPPKQTLKAVPPRTKASTTLKPEDLAQVTTRKGLVQLLRSKQVDVKRAARALQYERELRQLQVELVKLQRDVQMNGRRVAIVFEGRDAAGKGGAIRRFVEHLNPRSMRVVALPKPTEVEKGQWYFQRYVTHLPNPGELAFFDRSWYNRAVVEPVNQFCTKKQYQTFMQQVPEFEHMLYEDNIEVIKFWFSISKEEQDRRFKARKKNPLKQWKISPVDDKAQEHWDLYTKYKEEMFSKTHTSYAPWVLVKANSKIRARLEAIRHVLNTVSYEGKDKATVNLHPDPNIILRFHRRTATED